MTIHHVTFSTSGGAGMVAKLLVEGQRALDLDSVLHKQMDRNLWEQPFVFPFLTLTSAIDNFVISNRSEGTQLSLTRNNTNADVMSLLKPEDILHLHWVTGMFDPKILCQLSKKVKRIVWTLHDMEPFTGGCHHSGTCNLYESECSPCPQVRSPFRKAIRQNLALKMDGYDEINNLEIVAPTSWIAGRAKSSRLFGHKPVHVIENPIAKTFFNNISTKQAVREELGISMNSFVAVFIAADLDNPGKQVREALDVFLQNDDSEFPRVALLIGKTKSSFESDKRVRLVGAVDSIRLSHIARAADLHISMSKAESAGLTIAETAALGIMSIVRSGSGMSDMILRDETGLIVDDFAELKQSLDLLSKNRDYVQKLCTQARVFAQQNFRLDVANRKYIGLYNS